MKRTHLTPICLVLWLACTQVSLAQADARTRGSNQNVDRTFYPPKASQITGVVVDTSGAPLANVLVKVFKKDSQIMVGRTQTEPDGRYKLEIKAKGTFYVVFSNEGYMNLEQDFVTAPQVITLRPSAAGTH